MDDSKDLTSREQLELQVSRRVKMIEKTKAHIAELTEQLRFHEREYFKWQTALISAKEEVDET